MLDAGDLRTLRRLRLLRMLKPTCHVMIFNCPARCSGKKPAQPRAVLFILASRLTISTSLITVGFIGQLRLRRETPSRRGRGGWCRRRTDRRRNRGNWTDHRRLGLVETAAVETIGDTARELAGT
jgi:hypothetical protein